MSNVQRQRSNVSATTAALDFGLWTLDFGLIFGPH
jgi:hypothetical protein